MHHPLRADSFKCCYVSDRSNEKRRNGLTSDLLDRLDCGRFRAKRGRTRQSAAAGQQRGRERERDGPDG